MRDVIDESNLLYIQAVAGINYAKKRPTPLFRNMISVLQYEKELYI